MFRQGKWHFILLHGAFIVILTGAGITHYWGKEGMMHLREGEKTDLIWLKDADTHESLPFEIELQDFKLLRYPGSLSPSSYESYLKIHLDGKTWEEKIYMNHTLDLKGYRFFQASYDEDELGSILSVSYDRTGRTITYTGYALLFLGLLGTFFNKHSRFMTARKKLNSLSIKCCIIMAIAGGIPLSLTAQDRESHVESFGSLPMQSVNGRIVPVSTFAGELVQKLKIEDRISVRAEEWLLQLLGNTAQWIDAPIIPVGNKGIRQINAQWDKEYISYRDAFSPEGKYLLQEQISSIYHKAPETRNQLDKDLIKLDERINIIHQLFSFKLLRIFPLSEETGSKHWYAPGDNIEPPHSANSRMHNEAIIIKNLFDNYHKALKTALQDGEWNTADMALEKIRKYQLLHAEEMINIPKLKAEVNYNKHRWLNTSKKIYLIIGGLLLIIAFYRLLKNKRTSGRKVLYLLLAIIAAGFILHSYSLTLRWYISGYAPWSNSYETIVTMSWISVLIGMLLFKRDIMTCALATLFGGIALFVSELNWMDPQITPLVPVLKSPWLMYHVATLMAAYGFFGICCLLGSINLILYGLKQKRPMLDTQIKRLTLINEMLQIAGSVLMTIGIFLGAIWANESWGRYWSWDPKETWALISLVVYAIILHLHWFYPTPDNKRFNLLSQWGFLSILMTYFGVNYFLSGMHSYGNANALSGLSAGIYIPIILFFVLPAIIAFLSPYIRPHKS